MADLAVGVIGAGGMGARHGLNLHLRVAGACVAGVYDLDPARATELAARCGGARPYPDAAELIRDPAIEAVVIASPDPTHAALVQECLRHGKPVLCEKPLATTAADARSIVEAEQALGRRLVALGLMRRFDPQHLAVRDAIASGELGRPLLFKGVHRNAAPQGVASGPVVITNSGSHDIDSARWLLGQEVEEVFVRGVRTRPSFSEETRDLLLMQLALSGGCLATIELFVAAGYGYEVSAEVVAEHGSALTLQPAGALVRARRARAAAVPADWLARFEGAYLAELSDWVRSIRGGEPFGGASGWDGYMAQVVTDACIESLQSGAPIAVPSPPRPPFYR